MSLMSRVIVDTMSWDIVDKPAPWFHFFQGAGRVLTGGDEKPCACDGPALGAIGGSTRSIWHHRRFVSSGRGLRVA